MTNKQVAESILTNVGGPTNISSVVHCATRLRFKLKDESKADTNALNQLVGVIQVVQSAGQYQVVIGSHVGDVYQELIQLANLGEQTSDQQAPKGKLLDRAIDVISGIFTPYLGIIAGAGVLKGLLNLIVFLGFLETTSGAYQLLYTAADAAFYFMPIALAITAARKFKANEFLALALAMTMLYPGFIKFAAGIEAAGGSLDFFGLPIIFNSNIGYNSTVIPIILAVWILSYVERAVRKVVPNFLRIFGVTLVTLLIMVPLTYIVIGPLGLIIGTVLGKMIQAIYAQSAILTGALLGGFWQVLVIFGMHWGLVPITLNNLATTGMDTMLPMTLAGVLAQAGAAFGVFLKTKDAKMKGLAGSGTLTALFGITEPTVYGVTLPLKKPFIFGCIGGAIGGALIGFFNVIAYGFGQSILTFPLFISPEGDSSKVILAALVCGIAALFAAVMTYFFGDVTKNEEKIEEALDIQDQVHLDGVTSPLTGHAFALEEMSDPAFASGTMGEGIAIEPKGGKLYAPADGEILVVFPTKHAIGMKTEDGAELLIHIGINTVELNGEGFISHVAVNDHVKKGQLLIEFDTDFIRQKEKATETAIIVTNSTEFSNILFTKKEEIQAGELLFTVEK